jgi:hypothetical protein
MEDKNMSSSIRVFDEASGRTKTITLIAEQGVLSAQQNGTLDTYLKMSVDASIVGGTKITPYVITGEGDLVLGTTQYDGSTDSYTDLGAAVDDYVLRIVHGVPGDPDSAMDFSS